MVRIKLAAMRRVNWRHGPALLAAVIFLLPLVYMVTGSLRKAGLPPPRSPELLPSPLAWDNYAVNSLIVAAFAVPLSVLVASWAGFAMSRLEERLRTLLIALSLTALMVPVTALLVPRFVIFRQFGLIDTYVPLIAPALIGMSPFYVLIFYWAFRRIPGELYEAARLEGLSPFQTWRRVGLPLVRPVTFAVALLAFVVTWSNFLDPLIYIFDPDRFTLPLGLKLLRQLDRRTSRCSGNVDVPDAPSCSSAAWPGRSRSG